MTVTSHKQKLLDDLNKNNFLLLSRNELFQSLINNSSLPSYQKFKQSWNNLEVDPYLEKGKQLRLRRYSVLQWSNTIISKTSHEDHYQSKRHNHVYGGISRSFSPISNSELNGSVLNPIIQWNIALFNTSKKQSWRIQSHQFRILATENQAGKPTPEGIHQDGADYVFIMLIKRHNISGGRSNVYNKKKSLIVSRILMEEGECILINDGKLLHGVSNIKLNQNASEGYRDVLVLTFHKTNTLSSTENK